MIEVERLVVDWAGQWPEHVVCVLFDNEDRSLLRVWPNAAWWAQASPDLRESALGALLNGAMGDGVQGWYQWGWRFPGLTGDIFESIKREAPKLRPLLLAGPPAEIGE